MTGATKVELDLFAVLWNQMQNQATPVTHLRILRWLEGSWRNADTRLLLMAFRSCGKSTCMAIFCAWLLYQNPDLRILVLAADDMLARKMVRNIRRILEKHLLTYDLIPQKADQWANDRFTLNRQAELRDPSVLAKGISANITGSRADIIIYDDVEVPNTCQTAEARDDLRERLSESRFILTPNGTQIYIGTPHSHHTIYRTKNEDDAVAFLQGFRDLLLPILTDKGESIWPERFDMKNIRAMERQVGPQKFAAQMMLQPVNIAEGRLNVQLLQHYNAEITYQEAVRKPVLSLNGKRFVSCSSYWDPAFGSAKGDSSVWAVVFTDEDGHYYVHHIAYIKIDTVSQDDEATQQCKIIAALLRQFHVPSVTVEINGIGKFLPAILRRELRALGVQASVIEQANRLPKVDRILEAFDAVMAAQALSISAQVAKSQFMDEMREWRPIAKNGRDDGLDAVAGALRQVPVRIALSAQKGTRQNWQGNSTTFKAKT
jgi:hypothetical protein